MKPHLVLALLCASVSLAFGQNAQTVFTGIPSVKHTDDGEGQQIANLDGDGAQANRCVISMIGGRYYWASRNNVEMQKQDGPGAYVIFTAINGGGYVKCIKPEFKGKELTAGEKFDYIEHIHLRLTTVTYWGLSQEIDSSSFAGK